MPNNAKLDGKLFDQVIAERREAQKEGIGLHKAGLTLNAHYEDGYAAGLLKALEILTRNDK